MSKDSIKINLPKELKLKFKAYAALADRDMSDIVGELISKWVEHQESIRSRDKGNSI